MQFSPPLQSARLLRRYKRFLAEVCTPQGQTLTLHCANTGAMTGCATPGDKVWYSTSLSASRRYPHSWELTETHQGEFICVNTHRANALVREALQAGQLAELADYSVIRSEVKSPAGSSRFDFLLSTPDHRECYLEVKSVTLADKDLGYFPDSVTLRGHRHCRELITLAEQGQATMLLFVVLHSAIRRFAPASHIDPVYASLLDDAQRCGVQVLACKACISPQGMSLVCSVPVIR